MYEYNPPSPIGYLDLLIIDVGDFSEGGKSGAAFEGWGVVAKTQMRRRDDVVDAVAAKDGFADGPLPLQLRRPWIRVISDNYFYRSLADVDQR